MDSKKIDLLNIFLILISLVVAIIIPFKLFLFSYAILGPLHYLTEINWLNKNNFFIKNNKTWKRFYITLSALVVTLAITKNYIYISETSLWHHLKDNGLLLSIILFFSVGLILFRKTVQLLLFLLFSISLALLIKFYVLKIHFLIGIFIPTLVHVFIFTLLFMLYGALKSKSKIGYYCCVLLILAVVFIFSFDFYLQDYKLSDSTHKLLHITISPDIIKVINRGFYFDSPIDYQNISNFIAKLQIFISFTYTYHYLNWFSKTSIIGWKEALSKKSIYLILFIWVVSIIIYSIDYKTGYVALFTLSLLHVFLEFPLNIVTIKQLFSLGKKNKSGFS